MDPVPFAGGAAPKLDMPTSFSHNSFRPVGRTLKDGPRPSREHPAGSLLLHTEEAFGSATVVPNEIPPQYLLSASAPVKALIGSSPVRAYRHGSAPQGVTAPYVTWFLVSGLPELNVSGTPSVDQHTVQVDCWSDTDAGVEALATAVRNAIEPTHHMTRIAINDRDPETLRFRIGLQFDFWQHFD